MNQQITKLAKLAGAAKRTIVGLMSGTSLDGLDIALCEFYGSGRKTTARLINFVTIPYPDDFKLQLKAISFRREADLQRITLLHAALGNFTAKLILQALDGWNIEADQIDLIASHGQTIFHAPFSLHQERGFPNATFQIGDGDHIAVATGIITLSDFRQKHVAAGGEGAPLAVYGDHLLFSSATENRILLNIGGISNFTYLPSERNPDQIFSTDTGPGNTLMDQFIQQNYPGKFYDRDAEIAKSGRPDEALVTALLDHVFFSYPFPRTTGPELFNLSYLSAAQSASGRVSLPAADIMASLCEFTVRTIVSAIRNAIQDESFEIYLSGGGMHNPLLKKRLSEELGIPLRDTASLGIDPDAKEAVLFALLANECVAGGDTDFGKSAEVPSVSMGKISLP